MMGFFVSCFDDVICAAGFYKDVDVKMGFGPPVRFSMWFAGDFPIVLDEFLGSKPPWLRIPEG